jgi:FkbM family methyltransferase
MNITRFLGKCRAAFYITQTKAYPSFSQAGEDQIIRYLLDALKITDPSYLDIGANHPIIGNNTYLFYARGSSGVCVEPDEDFYSLIKKHRRRDKVLNVGIGITNTEDAILYVFPPPYTGWNTFSKEEAINRETESGIKIKTTRKVRLININQLISENFKKAPNILSIDVEGLDLQILQSLDFEQYAPDIICVETISFSTHNKEEKIEEIISFVRSKGYFVFGDTHINTIFCKGSAFN